MKRFVITSFCLLSMHAPAALAQTTWHKPKKLLTIGFTTGVNTSKTNYFKSIPCSTCYTNGLYLRRYINRHLSMESGIQFSADHFTTPVVRVTPGYYISRTQPIATNIPFAIRYYMGHADKKLVPSIGAGCYYSFGYRGINKTDGLQQTPSSNPAFVPFYMMQGLSYKISTKIELNETIHFTPKDENHCTQLGLDLGIGYHL